MTGTPLATTRDWWALVEQRAAATPADVMVRDERGRSLTFDGFRQTAEAVAAGLVDLGLSGDHVVSWQLPTTIEAAVLMAALARLGVAQNPIIPILRRAEVELIVGQLASDWLVVAGVRRGFDHGAMARAIADEAGGVRVLVLDELGDEELSLPRGDPSTLPPRRPPDGDVRWYYYSSGTTAAPKGARHTDAAVVASSAWIVDGPRFFAGDPPTRSGT